MALLRVVSGLQAGREYPLTGNEATIGRHPACQIIIDVGAVSRHHAKISRDGESFWIEDLKSRNGTWVNDREIEGKTQLHRGDILKICDVAMTFVDENDSSSKILRDRDKRGAHRVLIEDESESGNTTIMSKVEVSSNQQRARLTATPAAKLQALIEITQNLSKVLTLDDVFPNVLDSLFRIFVQADRGFIVMRTGDGELVPTWSKTRHNTSDQTIRISREIVNHVLTSKTAVLSADATADKRFEPSQSVANLRIRSFMCAPLIDGEGRVLGVIQLDTADQASRFQDEDLEVLATVALQAGIAIDAAQMHENALTRAELDRDLELAHEVQHGFLPLRPPQIEGYDFFDFYEPANHVGGDFYDYVTLPDSRLAIVVADVVGHGIAAALLMAKLSAETRFSLAAEPSLGQAAHRLNRSLVNLQLDRFVTMVIGLIDPNQGKLQIVNAGHMSPLLRNSSGEVQPLGKGQVGLPLGIIENYDYEVFETTLAPGNALVFMTDGIFECVNEKDEQLGLERIRNLVAKEPGNAERVGNAILQRVRQHLGPHVPDDDMCLVCLHRQSTANEPA